MKLSEAESGKILLVTKVEAADCYAAKRLFDLDVYEGAIASKRSQDNASVSLMARGVERAIPQSLLEGVEVEYA